MTRLDEDWPKGATFRVVKEGGQLSGFTTTVVSMTTRQPIAWRVWKLALQPGDEIVCEGPDYGFGSDPGYGVHFRCRKTDDAGATKCEFQPTEGSLFNYRPASGYLELIREPVGQR
jgi:hypothetical protein